MCQECNCSYCSVIKVPIVCNCKLFLPALPPYKNRPPVIVPGALKRSGFISIRPWTMDLLRIWIAWGNLFYPQNYHYLVLKLLFFLISFHKDGLKLWRHCFGRKSGNKIVVNWGSFFNFFLSWCICNYCQYLQINK